MDQSTAVIYGVDLTPLIENDALDPGEHMLGFIDRLKEEVAARLANLG